MKFICERAKECDDDSCLERKPHDKQKWCKRRGKCITKGIMVKCIEVN